MKTPSFADILHELLAEDSPTPPADEGTPPSHRAAFEPSAPLFNWRRPPLKSSNGKAYPKTVRPVVARLEPVVKLEDLQTVHRLLAERMIQWGGQELALGLSASALKKAHRRLVKQLHPDLSAARAQASASPNPNHELFLQVQSAYETLRGALPEYLSGSAGGNGSASAAGSRHQDAA